MEMNMTRNEPTTIFHRFAARISARRQERQLSELDDRLLADIGLTRGEIHGMRRLYA